MFDEKTVVEEAMELSHERCERDKRGGYELRLKICTGITSSLSVVTYLVGVQGPFRAMRMREPSGRAKFQGSRAAFLERCHLLLESRCGGRITPAANHDGCRWRCA